MQNLIHAIILAGGMGTRLAPLSTPEKPKQFLDLTGSGKSLLQETAERALNLMSAKSVITIGNRKHESLLYSQMMQVSPLLTENIILEDKAMNTAFSVRAALEEISEGIVVIMPSDHFISGNYAKDFIKATKLACDRKIATLGIKPTFPSTDYGYLLGNIFVEKPDAELAQKLIEKGALWNSGIFVADAAVLKREYDKFYPRVTGNVSFDKAIMEKTLKMQSLTAGFEWSDLGSFESLRKFPCYETLVEPILRAEKDSYENIQ